MKRLASDGKIMLRELEDCRTVQLWRSRPRFPSKFPLVPRIQTSFTRFITCVSALKVTSFYLVLYSGHPSHFYLILLPGGILQPQSTLLRIHITRNKETLVLF